MDWHDFKIFSMYAILVFVFFTDRWTVWIGNRYFNRVSYIWSDREHKKQHKQGQG